jgi:hypothetical protein
MKRLLILLAVSAQAAVFDGTTMHDAYPGTLTAGGKTVNSPNAQDFAAAGWTEHPGAASAYVVEGGSVRPKTAGELAAEAAAEAVAQSNALELASLPQQFPTGIAIPDGAGHYYEAVPYGGGFIAAQVSDSPLTSAVRRASGVAAAKAFDDSQRVALRLIKGSIATNRNDAQAIVVASTSSTAQVRSAVIELRRELIDLNADLQDFRRWQAQQLKEASP